MTGIMTLVSCLTLMGVALALRRQLAMAFSNDPQVIAVAAAAMPILAGSLLGDGVNCAASGVALCAVSFWCRLCRLCSSVIQSLLELKAQSNNTAAQAAGNSL